MIDSGIKSNVTLINLDTPINNIETVHKRQEDGNSTTVNCSLMTAANKNDENPKGELIIVKETAAKKSNPVLVHSSLT